MDINQNELRQVTLFKDSVLSAADARRMEIITQAQQDSDKTLADAQAQCQLADHDAVTQRMALDTERQTSAATQAARQQLLAAREALVEDMFRQVESRLLDFTGGEKYGDWLAEKLAAHPFEKGAAVTVSLRGADMAHAPRLEKALPGSTVRQDDSIRLGGLTATDGRLLYDDTLDTLLAAEKEDFYLHSGLIL